MTDLDDRDIVDLYAGPGGWSEALRALGRGRSEIGIEYDAAACLTRTAAGHATIRADIGTLDPVRFAGRLEGLIASPPCQAFSSAGKGAARNLLPQLLDSIRNRRWDDRADPDPRVWLIVNLGRWLQDLTPEWIALEQVPAVLPIWHAYADLLRGRGYSVWVGILNAADFGVPQTRRRAILIASNTRTVHPPEPTHAAEPVPSLFGELAPWVTMADALGWHGVVEDLRGAGAIERHGDRPPRSTDRPAPTVRATGGGHASGGFVFRPLLDRRQTGVAIIDASEQPAPTVTAMAFSHGVWKAWWGDPAEAEPYRNEARLQLRAGSHTGATVRDGDEPAPTLAFGHSWAGWQFEPVELSTHSRTETGGTVDPNYQRPIDEPAPTIRQQSKSWTFDEGEPSAAGIHITPRDALILQSFRPDYPVQGTKTKQFEQIGNAIPPRLAWHVLRQIVPTSRSDQEQAEALHNGPNMPDSGDMTATATAPKFVAYDIADFDDLTSFESVPTAGRQLREGMLLVDPDLGTPVYGLDHRLGDGPGRWFVYSFELRKWESTTLSASFSFPVAVQS